MESFIYKLNELKDDETWNKFASDSDKTELERLSAENDDWLYSDEGFSSNHTEFDRRYNEMYEAASPVFFRI